MGIKYYLKNCFLLLIPVVIWNILFRPYSPEIFHGDAYWNNIPLFIKWPENILMIFVLILPMFMPLKVKKRSQKTGLILYLAGLSVYLLAWRPLVLYPEGSWCNKPAGFFTLAISLLFILTGIGLIGDRLSFKIRYNRMIYILLSCLYVLIHISHYFIFNSSN